MPIASSLKCRAALPLAAVLVGSFLTSTARAEPPAAPEAPAPQRSAYTKDGRLGSVRAGPTLGIGAPDGVRLGAFAKWRGLLAGGGAFSLLPTTTLPGVSAKVVRVSGEVFARVHPFRNAFFLGVAGGYAQTKGTMAEQVVAFKQTQRVETHAYATALYVAPQIGFQWMLPLGVTIGCDVGVEIPIATTGPTFDASRYGLIVPVEGKGSVADATRYVTTIPVPVVHLLEIGVAL